MSGISQLRPRLDIRGHGLSSVSRSGLLFILIFSNSNLLTFTRSPSSTSKYSTSTSLVSALHCMLLDLLAPLLITSMPLTSRGPLSSSLTSISSLSSLILSSFGEELLSLWEILSCSSPSALPPP